MLTPKPYPTEYKFIISALHAQAFLRDRMVSTQKSVTSLQRKVGFSVRADMDAVQTAVAQMKGNTLLQSLFLARQNFNSRKNCLFSKSHLCHLCSLFLRANKDTKMRTHRTATVGAASGRSSRWFSFVVGQQFLLLHFHAHMLINAI